MMADGASASVYTSKYTPCSSVASDRDYADSYDIALIFNTGSNLNECVKCAKDILTEQGYVVRDSREHGFDAGLMKTETHFNEILPAKYRIVIFNVAYKKHDLPLHGSMLYNRKLTTRENTLIVLRKKHLKILPEELKDLQRHELENVTGKQLAEIVTKFVKGDEDGPHLNIEKYDNQYKIFQDIVDNFSGKRSFILIANVAHPVPTCIRHLARVPWLKVFDFDNETREDGIFSIVKPYLTPGKFAISSSDDTPRAPSDRNIDWTRWLNAERESNSEDASDAHISAISQYCSGQKVATLMILWYTEDHTRAFALLDLVRDIKSAFKSNRGIRCVLCTSKVPEDNTALNWITRGSNRDDFRFVIPLAVLSRWVETELEEYSENDTGALLLPSHKRDPDHDGTVTLSERHYNWLSTDMDVLTFSQNARTREPSTSEGIDFLQGGTISWKTLEDSTFDARRGIMKNVIDYINEEHIEKGISGAVYVHHHPGSGGTTFGRRVLWEMRKTVPCLSVHPPFEDTEEFREKIKFVRNHTNITVLLLMDGRADVEKILTTLSYEKVVILNIVRYYRSMENRREAPAHFYLRDEITKEESAYILPIYSQYGEHSCEELRQRSPSQKTYMYEYGLTSFTENFFGVRRYVEGHLNLEGERQPWHYVIAFLALALHYGQKMLPCEMFSHLLKTPWNSTVKKTDIPFSGRQLVKEDGDKWSISYTEVAREVLKQLLTREGEPSPTGSRTLNLSGAACDELKELAIYFIKEMRRSLADRDAVPRHKLLILRDVFIMRNETQESQDRNSKYGMLLRDVDKNESRGDILKKLVECFPKHADFHAHLGRYYGKSGFIDEAEKSFQMAIEVRMDELALHHGRYQDSDEVLQRVHHMLGSFYLNRIKLAKDNTLELDILNIIELANKAISQFEESRKYFMLGTNPTYGLLGEVKVRLEVAKIAEDLNLLRRDGSGLSHHLHKLRELSWQSFGICDHLLAQCIEQATEHEIQNSEFSYCTKTLMFVFQHNVPLLEEWAKRSSTLSSNLCQIAVLKQSLCIPGQRFAVFSVHGRQEKLERLLKLYEAVIRGTTDGRKRISSEMLEWLKIIRRTGGDYSLQTVLELVEKWDRRNEKNSLSTYYHYLLNVVMAIAFPGENMSQIYRKKAEKLKGKLESSEKSLARHVLFRSHEWLGNSINPTINILVHRDVLGPSYNEVPKNTSLLRRCTGTIITVKGWYGWLHLDGSSDPVIEVFFNPQRYGLTSQHANENVRAEFYVGFNARHGAEAFGIVLIETRVCICGNATEVRASAPPSGCRVCGRPFSR